MQLRCEVSWPQPGGRPLRQRATARFALDLGLAIGFILKLKQNCIARTGLALLNWLLLDLASQYWKCLWCSL